VKIYLVKFLEQKKFRMYIFNSYTWFFFIFKSGKYFSQEVVYTMKRACSEIADDALVVDDSMDGRGSKGACLGTPLSPSYIILNMSSVYDANTDYFIYASIDVLGDIDPFKLLWSCPSDREKLNFSIYDDEGEMLPGWTTLQDQEMIDFQRQHHCLVIGCKYDE
jgi:hypothetical protein